MHLPNSLFRWGTSIALAAVLVVVSACSGPRETTDREPPTDPVDTVEPVNMAAYEDFDPSAYPDPPPAEADVAHDVPSRLMQGEVRGGEVRTVQGYRIQIFSAQDKSEADRRYARAVEWWEARRQAGDLDGVYAGNLSDPPVYVVYRQPYYRVRVGNFATRSEALRMMRLIEEEFSSAFVVPDRVTVTR